MYKKIFKLFGLSGSPDERGCYPVSGGGSNQYTIQSGDTFWSISQKLDTDIETIMAANPGVIPTSLYVGQVINLP